MRVLLNGKALAFQASHEGSIPFTRSNKQLILVVFFILKI